MTIYNWSALTNGQVVRFVPAVDVLHFDDTSISATSVRLGFSPSPTDAVNGTLTIGIGTKSVTLGVPATSPSPLAALTTTNFTFANGSLFTVGDNTIGTASDNLANTLTGGSGNDALMGLGGNDALNGGSGGFDQAVYSGAQAGYSFSLSGGNIVITDTNLANGNDGVDQLISVEGAQFIDGSIRVAPAGEFRVNSSILNNQMQSSIAALNDGGFVVTWKSFEAGDVYVGGDIYAQRYDADGTPHGLEFRVNTTTARDQSNPAIAGLANGGFAVAWQSIDPQYGDYHVYAQRYDASGIADGTEFRVGIPQDPFAVSESGPSIAALPNGDFVVTWYSHDQRLGYGGSQLHGQRYNVSGNPIGAEFLNPSGGSASIAPLADGGFVVTWLWNEITAQRYDASGVPQGAAFVVNTSMFGGLFGQQDFQVVTGLTNGGFVVAWESLRQDGSDWGIFAQRFDASGAPQGGEFRVNTFTFGDQSHPSIAALANGGFVVTWQSYNQDGEVGDIYAQRYDASGVAQGAEFLVNNHTAGHQDFPEITTLADGSFVGIWDSIDNDGTGYNVYAQRFDSKGNAVATILTGDANDNAIQWSGTQSVVLDGGLGADRLLGGSGDDTLTGGSGNDMQVGGAGNDRLVGGGGFDFIFGGDGNDWIEGETGNDPLPVGQTAGNDALSGDAGNDTILAGAGDDSLYGDSGTDFLIGELGNDLAYGGSEWDAIDGRQGNDTLYGGDGDDIMMGEAGENSLSGAADIIYGEAGNDLLDGGAGNDVIYGGDGNDVIDGDNGNDYIVGGQGAEIMLGSNAVAYGGPTQGSDLFVYQAMSDGGDSIYGFDVRPGQNDGIDLRPLFDALGYAGTTPRANGYLYVFQNGTNTDIYIDSNGAVGGVNLTRMVTLVDTVASGISDNFFLFQ
jgi:Ca2+-binding RTX toxin-like protein